ncbi:hypothetical protein [Oleiagrimonas sp. C23AA]|uniref:hypothetical protein n=1 Tax=Oleiagrimonas sp. C23AA TaxID=2719047 RepID=UPI00142182FF|nr:hypothetical protein [Oleiagrimonas sp. C23AA]NII10036.1 hypothetical protein [Oleiagrimonas sp. C23AA]
MKHKLATHHKRTAGMLLSALGMLVAGPRPENFTMAAGMLAAASAMAVDEPLSAGTWRSRTRISLAITALLLAIASVALRATHA